MILILLGCYLLDDGAIDCAAGEPCARDSLPEGDADTDADADTDLPGAPELGVAYGSLGGSDWSFVVVDPQGNEVLRESTPGAVEGPVAWRDELAIGLLLQGDQAWVVDAQGATSSAALPEPARDLEWVGSRLLVLFANGLSAVEGDQTTWLVQGAFQNASRLASDGEGEVWIVDSGLGKPTLYGWNEEAGLQLLHADFDDHTGRSVALFAGPDQQPWVCSAGGGVWSVAALADGDDTPARLADNQLSAVVDCGYDPAADEFLLLSKSLGVVRLGPDNATRVWVQDPDLRRGQVYRPFD